MTTTLAGRPTEGGALSKSPLRLLMEMRPCFDGFAGIPQETRLLFAAFARSADFKVGGLLSPPASMARPVATPPQNLDTADDLFAQTNRLIALDAGAGHGVHRGLPGRVLRRLIPNGWSTRFELRKKRSFTEPLGAGLDPQLFGDWLWMRLLRLGLPPADRALLERADFPVAQVSWDDAARIAVRWRAARVGLDMTGGGWGIHLAQTPSPYRLTGGRLVVRYHDAIPLLWPHTITNPVAHAGYHYHLLRANVDDGAYFVCTSDPVRDDLLRFFPQAEARISVIPTMSAGSFRPDPRPSNEIEAIIARGKAASEEFFSRSQISTLPHTPPRSAAPPTRVTEEPFLLAVSTLEPRKNYGFLMRAAAMARRSGAKFRLVLVANLGWRSDEEAAQLRRLVAEDIVCHLVNLTGDELRALYSAAWAVICPSRAEGFDLATVEAMACGAAVFASDIPVHRWVCGEAAEYFDPYDEEALAQRMSAIVAAPREEGHLAALRASGLKRAKLYRPEILIPKWEATLAQIGEQTPKL